MAHIDTEIAYTDGSCIGNPGPGGWAVMIGREKLSGFLPWTTNNLAELTAVYKAVETAEPGTSLTIVTDSKLVIGWLAQGWKRNQKHIDDAVRQIRDVIAYKDLHITFEHTPGHAQNLGNNMVDRMARKEAELASFLVKKGEL
jgi:ribonuclease HI